MRIPCVAVLAAELAATIRVDAVGKRKLALRYRLVQNASHLQRLNLDQVAIVGVFGCSGQTGDSRGLLGKNWEERRVCYFRHLFAYGETTIGVLPCVVKRCFSTVDSVRSVPTDGWIVG